MPLSTLSGRYNRLAFAVVLHPLTQKVLQQDADAEPRTDSDDIKKFSSLDDINLSNTEVNYGPQDARFDSLRQAIVLYFHAGFRPRQSPLHIHVSECQAHLSWTPPDVEDDPRPPYFALYNTDPIPFFPHRLMPREKTRAASTATQTTATPKLRRHFVRYRRLVFCLITIVIHALVACLGLYNLSLDRSCPDDVSQWPPPDILLYFAPLSLPREITRVIALHAAAPFHFVTQVPQALASYQKQHSQTQQGDELKERRAHEGWEKEPEPEDGTQSLHFTIVLARIHSLYLCNQLETIGARIQQTPDTAVRDVCRDVDDALDNLSNAWTTAYAYMAVTWPDSSLRIFLFLSIHLRELAVTDPRAPPFPHAATVMQSPPPAFHNKTTVAFFDILRPHIVPDSETSLLNHIYTGHAHIHTLLAEFRNLLIHAEALFALAKNVGVVRSSSVPLSYWQRSASPLRRLWFMVSKDGEDDERGDDNDGQTMQHTRAQQHLDRLAHLINMMQDAQPPIADAQRVVHKTLSSVHQLGNLTAALASVPLADTVMEGSDADEAGGEWRWPTWPRKRQPDKERPDWWRGSPWVSEENLIGTGGLGGLDLPGGIGRAVRRTMYYLPDLRGIASNIEVQLRVYLSQSKELHAAYSASRVKDTQLIQELFASSSSSHSHDT